MTDLITRLSKLGAPDREVDALIVAELEPHIFDAPGFTPIRPIPSFHIDPQGDAIRFDGGGIMCLSYFPRYTASVDAVIALAKRVFGKVGYSVAETEDDEEAPFAFIHVNGEAYLGEGAMPAIALCIALLRAKEANL